MEGLKKKLPCACEGSQKIFPFTRSARCDWRALKDSNVRPCHPLHHEDGWWLAGNTVPLSSNCETLLNFIKGMRPRKGEKKKQGVKTKVQVNKQPKRGRPQGGKGTPKYRNLRQSLEAYQLKKREVTLIKQSVFKSVFVFVTCVLTTWYHYSIPHLCTSHQHAFTS